MTALVYKIQKSKNNILGKHHTHEQIAVIVAELYLGNEEKRIKPHNKTEIGRAIGYDSRDSIYRFMATAEKMGLLKKIGNRYVKPDIPESQQFEKFTKEHPILNDSIVSEWYAGLNAKNHNKGIKIAPTLLNRIENICNTCHVSPAQIISSKANATEIKNNFVTAYREHRVISRNKLSYKADIEGVDYNTSYAIASICGKFGNFMGTVELLKCLERL